MKINPWVTRHFKWIVSSVQTWAHDICAAFVRILCQLQCTFKRAASSELWNGSMIKQIGIIQCPWWPSLKTSSFLLQALYIQPRNYYIYILYITKSSKTSTLAWWPLEPAAGNHWSCFWHKSDIHWLEKIYNDPFFPLLSLFQIEA